MKTLACLFLALAMNAQLVFDKTVHDFGQISVKDGPVSCKFTVTNAGDAPATIFSVITSCGCTGVEWTRTAIAPGGQGEIVATYSNDDGPYPFDKTITVYMSDSKKPTVLHLKGSVTNKKNK